MEHADPAGIPGVTNPVESTLGTTVLARLHLEHTGTGGLVHVQTLLVGTTVLVQYYSGTVLQYHLYYRTTYTRTTGTVHYCIIGYILASISPVGRVLQYGTTTSTCIR